jgi:hypothetical protein
VLSEKSTELIVAANSLNDTGREDLLSELNELKACIRGEGALTNQL